MADQYVLEVIFEKIKHLRREIEQNNKWLEETKKVTEKMEKEIEILENFVVNERRNRHKGNVKNGDPSVEDQ